ncbi:MAG: hypothetical protein ACI4NE_08970 [Succinivibrio sp.]
MNIFMELKDTYSRVYRHGDPDDICALPDDVARLAVSNDTAISSYVDFHRNSNFRSCMAKCPFLVKRLKNLF